MDAAIGRILATLKSEGMERDTLVMFFCDNGSGLSRRMPQFDPGQLKLRGGKGTLQEGGIRVPLIVKWPGQVKPGSVTSFSTGFEDWIPTLLDLIEAEETIPADIDGISIAPTLLGKHQNARPFLYREFTGYGGQQAVWMGDWKGVRQRMLRKGTKDPLKIELYNLKTDIGEQNDVAAEHPEVVEKLRKLMAQQHVPSKDFPFKPID